MPLRLFRAAAAPAAFIAVSVLSWFLVATFMAPLEPAACAPAASDVAGLTALPSGGQALPSIMMDVPAAGGEDSRLAATYASSGLRFASLQAETPQPSSHTVHTRLDDTPEQLVTLLDGSLGPRPAHLMKCTFGEGSFRCGECATDGDCPAGQGCIINHDKGAFECAASECEDDSHCFPGYACRVAAGGAPGPVTRRCLQTGIRLAGEPCSRLPATREEACEEDLLCVNHRCGTPCAPGQPDSCPEGHTCEESPSGTACLPDCRKLGCPSDKQCAPLNDGAFQCLDLIVDECSDASPCGEAESCIVRGRAGRAGRFCAAACDSWKPDSCAADQVCGIGGPTGSACYARCDPQDLSTCPEGWLCTTVTEDLQTWGCLPDFMNGVTTAARAPHQPLSSAVP